MCCIALNITGPGCWELRAHGSRRKATSKNVPLIRALPTLTHMSLVALHEANICKFTISQNVDGLHLRSGLNPAQVAELHGNTNLEYCSSCNTKYMRDFSTREAVIYLFITYVLLIITYSIQDFSLLPFYLNIQRCIYPVIFNWNILCSM